MTQLKSTSNETVQMPLPPQREDSQGMEIYARFMRYLRCVPNSRLEIKILSSLQFSADMLDCSDAHVSKTLVDLGLRASRAAFPAEFLRYADQALMRERQALGGANDALQELQSYWVRTGEDQFAAFQGEFDLVCEEVFF